ncbi:lytic polysaccharide monooxygenase, partial [Macroventuria anomochaeta]
MSLRSVILATATLCAYVADAHVLMKAPVPYSVDKLDNSPITKAQYPCKSQNGFTVSTMNTMAVGEKQTLTLSGSAVHGGGSCQLSVTLDTEPTASSVFKVIKSMEGGCPGVSGEAEAYDFTLPDSIPNGKATFAWTWFSKLSGAPELYMNCAPIEVTGGASDDSEFQKLPNMLVANIDDTCKSVPNFAVQFPDPGSVVTNGGTNDLKAPTGTGCGATGTTPADSSSPTGSGAPASSAAAATTPAAGTGASGATPTTAPAAGGDGTCTTDGAIVCNGTTQFGLCNQGKVVWQAVAAGTTCSNGTIQKRGYNGRVVR